MGAVTAANKRGISDMIIVIVLVHLVVVSVALHMLNPRR